MSPLRFIVLMMATSAVSAPTLADDNDINFGLDVYKVLQRSCFECHGREKQEGALRLDSAAALQESETVVPNSPGDSELLRRIKLPKSDDEVMPAIGNPLSPSEIRKIERWILEGGVWPKDFQPDEHWSYIAPQRPDIPNDVDQFGEESFPVRNSVDAFIYRGLHEIGLKPSPAASPETQIRRLYFDLIGLPPTPREVDAFASNPTEDAYAEVVDDLLSRPQFGERWARPWLDLARYADSHGFQRDNFRDIWAYRDWVIQALNADMPFDQFTREQIAGDLIPNATEAQKIATGFHRCTPTNVEAGSLPEETRIEQVIDRVNTTGAVWLGSTFECCQCHDHKYDPFSTKEYYQLLAFYNNTVKEADRASKSPSSIKFLGPSMELSDAELERQRDEVATRRKQLLQEKKDRERQLAKALPAWIQQKNVIPEVPKVHQLSTVDFQSDGQKDRYRILDDQSVLLSSKNAPDQDHYVLTVEFPDDVANVTAIQLDALTHPELPGSGPGRGDSKKTNFVLNRFAATLTSGDAESPLSFSAAIADFSQKNWGVDGALSDKPKTGWAIAPEFGKPHWARFVLATPVNVSAGDLIRVKLDFEYGGARSIGRVLVSAVTGNASGKSAPTDVEVVLKKPIKEWSDKERRAVVAYRTSLDGDVKRLSEAIKAADAELTKIAPKTTLVMIEEDAPRMTTVFQRGDYRNPGERVQPGTPSVLHPLPQGPANRLTLAEWLTHRDNPLVARVTVNRWWAELFGNGIVKTVEDFGIKGERPTHPRLLDWLAVEFMDSGWSMKHVLKTIVTSTMYRQSSVVTERHATVDAENRYFARAPRYRMDAETIRDNLLSVSGLLSLKQFGPPIRPYQPNGIWSKVGGTSYKYQVSPGSEQHRRGVYVVIKRGAPYPSFINFDATARLACTVRRDRTNTPLQALTLLNDPVYVEAAQSLAKRVLESDEATDTDQKLRLAFQLCTARKPTNHELGVLQDLLQTQTSVNLANSERVRQNIGTIKPPAGMKPHEYSAWTSVAAVLINLHETITRN